MTQPTGGTTIRFKVSDNASPPNVVAGSFNVNVNPATAVIHPPVLTSIPTQSATIGKQLQLNLSSFASDPNTPPLPLTYSLTGVVPSGAMLNPTSGVFAWTPAATQPTSATTIRFKVSDNASPPNAVQGSFTVNVNPATAVIHPPVLATIPAQSATIGKQFQLNLSSFASDPNTPPLPLSYSLNGLVPPGAMLNPQTGVFTWTPSTTQQTGDIPISFRVSDSASSPNSVSGLIFVLVQANASSTPTPPLVTVTSGRLVKVKSGRGRNAKKETVLVLHFSGPLDPSSAERVVAYGFAPVIKIKTTGKGNSRIPTTIGLGAPAQPVSAVYNPSNDSVTLTPRSKFIPSQRVELIVSGGFMVDAKGRSIDGAHNGQSGSNFIATISRGRVTFGGLALGQVGRN